MMTRSRKKSSFHHQFQLLACSCYNLWALSLIIIWLSLLPLAVGADGYNFDSDGEYDKDYQEDDFIYNLQFMQPQQQSRRELQSDPSIHYFCGRGFADASRSCEHPCPSGSLEDCPAGMLCYYDTPCDSSDMVLPTRPPQPTNKPTKDPNLWYAPTRAPWAEDDPKLKRFCGRSWEDASATCTRWCPEGDDTKCPYGQSCFSDTSCKKKFPTGVPGLYTPPSPAPWADDDPRLSFFCGQSWGDAGQKCKTWCPDADDATCPNGESCYGGTTCKYTPEPTFSPTTPPPTDNPTLRPTNPTTSPTPAPVGRLPDDPANNMFCGTDWQQASSSCSLETYCGENGSDDCANGSHYCWHGVTCDVRDYISYELGGNVGRPSHKEIAESLGLTYPSDNPSDHYFCGTTLERASERCATPCPDGKKTNCGHAEYCFENTWCDVRVMPGYGQTGSPTLRPTFDPATYDNEENKMFCGTSWGDANSCSKKWCGDGSECPGDLSCFADTECNFADRGPLPPTLNPTLPPVTYDDDSNSYFCGASYPQAASECSADTHCHTGQHDECPGPSNYCWLTTCNVQDLIEPSPPRTPAPTRFTPKPTDSPQVYDDPKNFRFCGFTWQAASNSCKVDGAIPQWCPNGSNEECPPGQSCFSDTTCNRWDFTMPPTDRPTDEPTNPLTWPPTDAPVKYNDPINTSFCGESYTDAAGKCSVESHCPSGLHADCPHNEYCWIVLGCNIIEIQGPTPPPTSRPTQSPSTRFQPSEAPSFPPTDYPVSKPTTSPLEESDTRRSFYCGTSWSDANSKCQDSCPLMKGCPPGETCFGNTGCGKPDITPEPTPLPTPAPTPNPTPMPFDAVEAIVSPPPTDIAKFTIYPTRSPKTNLTPLPSHPSPMPISLHKNVPTHAPTSHPTLNPSPFPTTTKNIPLATTTTPDQANKPALDVTAVQLAYFPYSQSTLPKPPVSNAQRIQHIVESVKASLENDVFVIEVRSGALIRSSLYTYKGFFESLIMYTDFGVNGNYFYLGDSGNISTNGSSEQQNLEVEYGIANLALFLAKMMGTISLERCDPDHLSCGVPALEKTFQERNLKVQCSPRSPEAGMECPNDSGCVCVLGVLNHFVGAQSSLGGIYSGVNFCETNLLQSICSRRVDHGQELRWVAAFFHWVFFVQPYDDGVGFNYIDELHKFVREGMIDMNFVEKVADLSVVEAETAPTDQLSQKFIQNFFKVMIKLSEGMSQPMPQPEIVRTAPPTVLPTTRPTTPPTELSTDRPSSPFSTPPPEIMPYPFQQPYPTPVSTTYQKPAPTPDSNIPLQSDYPPKSTGLPSTSPTDAFDLMAIHNPTTGSHTTTNPPTTSINDDDKIELPVVVTDGNSSALSTAANNSNSSDGVDSFPQATTKSSPAPVSDPASAHPLDTQSSSPTPRRHWDYQGDLWYKKYFSDESTSSKNKISVCSKINIIMTMTMITFFYIL